MVSAVGQSMGGSALWLSAGSRTGASTDARNAGDAQQKQADEQQQIDKLAATDRKVRAHEQAHLSAGADLVRGGVSFQYVTGPDGKRYAVGGEVSVDASSGKTPQETIAKAARIRAAALAPADPSGQDRQAAAAAAQMEMQARQQLVTQAQEQRRSASGQNASAVAAYQSAGGLEASLGFKAVA